MPGSAGEGALEAGVAPGPAALLVACCDYRWRAAVEAYCREQLGISSWDALLVPGGIYLVSYPEALPRNYRVGGRMLDFLIEEHRPRRVVLVGHEGCSRYRAGLRLPPGRTFPDQQQEDLQKVARWLGERYPGLTIEAYYASGAPHQGGRFTRVA